jgi:hypothetical protein
MKNPNCQWWIDDYKKCHAPATVELTSTDSGRKWTVCKDHAECFDDGWMKKKHRPTAGGTMKTAVKYFGTTWIEERPTQEGRWWINYRGQTDIVSVRRNEGKLEALVDHWIFWKDVNEIDALWAGPIPNPEEP